MTAAVTALFFFIGLVMWLLVALIIIDAYMEWRDDHEE